MVERRKCEERTSVKIEKDLRNRRDFDFDVAQYKRKI